MIQKETIESIKQGVDLAALIQSRGISLKKNGRGYTGINHTMDLACKKRTDYGLKALSFSSLMGL